MTHKENLTKDNSPVAEDIKKSTKEDSEMASKHTERFCTGSQGEAN